MTSHNYDELTREPSPCQFVREIDIGKNIGLDKFNDMKPTSIMTVLTDKHGNLITATPGVIR